MNMVRTAVFFALILLLAVHVCATADERIVYPESSVHADPQSAMQRRLQNFRFTGLGGAGVAIPEAVSSINQNPALIHRFHSNAGARYSIVAGYERDSLFNKMILNAGFSGFINERTTIGGVYRYLKNSDMNYANEVTIALAGTVFDKGDDAQGGVDFGVNLRYETTKWDFRSVGNRPVHGKYSNDKGVVFKDSIVDWLESGVALTENNDYRILLDIGLFQEEIVENLDFGIVFNNIYGYSWSATSPVLKDSSKVSVGDTIAPNDTIYDSLYYVDDWEKKSDVAHKNYRRMTAGLAYSVPLMNDKVNILVPLDLEFFGLFNKEEKAHVALHTGLELWVAKGMVGLRFGYARAPLYIADLSTNPLFVNQHIFSGGGSLRLKKVDIDLYFTEYRQEWGLSFFTAFGEMGSSTTRDD